jgi:hypothetical protein
LSFIDDKEDLLKASAADVTQRLNDQLFLLNNLVDQLVLFVILGILILYDFQIIPNGLHIGRQFAIDIPGDVSHVLVAQRNRGACNDNSLDI